MRLPLYPCLWIAALLVSCDKSQDSGDSASDESGSRAARAGKQQRERTPSKHQSLRESLKAAMELESPEARNQALSKVAWSSLKVDPDIASKAFEQLSVDSAERIRLIQCYMARNMGDNPIEALVWADSLGSKAEIAAAHEQIPHTLKPSDFEQVAKLLLKPGFAGGELDGTAVIVLEKWAGNTPSDAAGWVAKFPPGDSRKVGMKTVVSQWIITDSQAALSWMAALNNPSVRQDASRAMAEVLRQQPPSLRESLLGLADPEIQTELKQQIDLIKQDEGMTRSQPNEVNENPEPEVPAPPDFVPAPEDSSSPEEPDAPEE